VSYLIVDLSSNNPQPDWKALKKAGVDGAWLKATEGSGYNAGWDVYSDWAPAARKVGIRVGAYHYAQPGGGDAVAEALNFAGTIAYAGAIQRKDLRPVLDFEVNPAGLSGAQLVAWARKFNAKTWETTGTLPLFYSYPAFIANMHAAESIGAGLWLAAYGPNDGLEHSYTVPAPWKKAVAHQYTSRGTLSGLARVDLSSAKSLLPLLAHPVIGLV
jgi:lysozyme